MRQESISEGSPNSTWTQQPTRRDRTPLWVLISVVVGASLPIFACIVLIFGSVLSLSVFTFGNSPSTRSSGGTGDAVAIVRIEGIISSGHKEQFGAGAVSGVVAADLEAAANDSSVKAIVLRIDSPGGGVTGAAQIYEALSEINKPVVVSMAGIAASGGYYVSAPAAYIFARPDSLTGSIGVISTFFNAEELLSELGVEVTVVASGPNKDFGSLWSELSPEQAAIWQTITDELFAEFVRVIADGRKLTEDEVLALADGRVFSGRQAVENGLVDELGDLEDAIEKAADLGGISGEPRLIEYERSPSLTDLFFGLSARLANNEVDQVEQMVQELTTPTLEYRYIGPQ